MIDGLCERLFLEPTEAERERATLMLFAAGFSEGMTVVFGGPDADERLLVVEDRGEELVLTISPEHPWTVLADLPGDEVAACSERFMPRLKGFIDSVEGELSAVDDDEDPGFIHVAVRSRLGRIFEPRRLAVEFVALALAAVRGKARVVAPPARQGSLSEALARGRR